MKGFQMNKGFIYENKILGLMKEHNLVSEDFINQETAGCDNTKPDMVISIRGKDINIEVKKDIRSQAGGTSIRYNNGEFEFVKPIEGISEDHVFEKLKEKEIFIKEFLDFHNAKQIPFTTTKKMWKESVDLGLLKKTNISLNCDMSFIENHYTNKNTFYIQIGKKGFYFMKEDIVNLGLPKLKGEMSLELRLTRGGSKLNKHGVRVCSASLRAQARISKLDQSQFNLEDIDLLRSLAQM